MYWAQQLLHFGQIDTVKSLFETADNTKRQHLGHDDWNWKINVKQDWIFSVRKGSSTKSTIVNLQHPKISLKKVVKTKSFIESEIFQNLKK